MMRVYRPLPIDHEQNEAMWEQVHECRELLKRPTPDTFLGRKTHEPPRREDQGRDVGDDDRA